MNAVVNPHGSTRFNHEWNKSLSDGGVALKTPDNLSRKERGRVSRNARIGEDAGESNRLVAGVGLKGPRKA